MKCICSSAADVLLNVLAEMKQNFTIYDRSITNLSWVEACSSEIVIAKQIIDLVTNDCCAGIPPYIQVTMYSLLCLAACASNISSR